MASDWDTSRGFYGALTLLLDGDEIEQLGAENYRLNLRWPAYEQFWQLHVVPATQRPANINVREGASRTVRNVMTANYETFCCVVAACDYTAMLQSDTTAARGEDWARLFIAIDSAIEAFARLRTSASNVLETLGHSFDCADGRDKSWLVTRRSIETYHEYLRGQSKAPSRLSDVDAVPTVIVVPRASLNDHGVVKPPGDKGTSLRLVDAIRLHLDDVIELLNAGHELLLAGLAPVQSNRRYHELWGWYSG